MLTRVLMSLALALSTLSAGAQAIAMQEREGIRFACGGVGAEERAELVSLRSQANVELLFVTGQRGGYVAEVEVAVFGLTSAPRVQFTAEGPICMLFLPIGSYR